MLGAGSLAVLFPARRALLRKERSDPGQERDLWIFVFQC